MSCPEKAPFKWTDEKVSRYWDWVSETPWGKSLYFSGMVGDAIINLVQDTVGVFGRICDYGAGRGALLAHILKETRTVTDVWAVEYSAQSADYICQKFKGIKCFRNCVLMETGRTSLEPSSLNMVFLIEVLEHLSDAQMEVALGEIRRVLSPGGVIVVTTPNNEFLDAETMICPDCGCNYHKWQHVRSFTIQTLRERMHLFGFAEEMCKDVNLMDYKTYSLKDRLIWKMIKRLTKPANNHLFYIGRKL